MPQSPEQMPSQPTPDEDQPEGRPSYHQEELFPVEDALPEAPEKPQRKDPFEHLELSDDERRFAADVANRLDNPELSGTRKLRAKVHEATRASIDKIEEKTDNPTKAVSFTLHKRREAMYKYAKRKHDKYERKSKHAHTTWGRKRNIIKMQRQAYEMDARKRIFEGSKSHYEERDERRKNAKEKRGDAFIERVEWYMEKQRKAEKRKVARRAKLTERLAGLPGVDPADKRKVQRKLDVIDILLNRTPDQKK